MFASQALRRRQPQIFRLRYAPLKMTMFLEWARITAYPEVILRYLSAHGGMLGD
jgi:hypothetical protein